LTIRSSSLVNEATGVKFLKGGMEPAGDKKRSTQGEKIAAAAAAVGPKGNRGRRPEGKNPQKPSDRNRRNTPPGQKREPAAAGASRPTGPKPDTKGHPRKPDTAHTRPKDPPLKDRLDYYKSKYGEDFKPAKVSEPHKPGLLGRVASLFGLGKKKSDPS